LRNLYADHCELWKWLVFAELIVQNVGQDLGGAKAQPQFYLRQSFTYIVGDNDLKLKTQFQNREHQNCCGSVRIPKTKN